MPLLLDTMVASELRKAKHPSTDPHFAAWAAATDLTTAYLSVIALHEIERGVLLTARKDPATAAVYRAWLDGLEEAFAGRILPVTAAAAKLAAAFHVPVTAPLADSFVAGIAQAHAPPAPPRHTSDFARFNVPLLNPWQPQ